MNDFEQAYQIAIVEHEGPIENNPKDPGGVTCWGITVDLLRELGSTGDVDHDGTIDADDVWAISRVDPEEAKRIWRYHLWDRFDYAAIPSQAVANKLFDLGVNLDWHQAHVILQRALNHFGCGLAEDGDLGPRTWRALGSMLTAGREADVLACMRAQAVIVYQLILKAHPEMEYARAGWMNRAMS